LPIFSHRPAEKTWEEVDETKTTSSAAARALHGICVVCRYSRVVSSRCNNSIYFYRLFLSLAPYLSTFNSFGARNSALG
jgi:hypothetical protein